MAEFMNVESTDTESQRPSSSNPAKASKAVGLLERQQDSVPPL